MTTGRLREVRRQVTEALVAVMPSNVEVLDAHRLPGKHRRRLYFCTVQVTGGDEPDRCLITIEAAAGGGDMRTAERSMDWMTDLVELALPASVDPPRWVMAYDQRANMWKATGTAGGFR